MRRIEYSRRRSQTCRLSRLMYIHDVLFSCSSSSQKLFELQDGRKTQNAPNPSSSVQDLKSAGHDDEAPDSRPYKIFVAEGEERPSEASTEVFREAFIIDLRLRSDAVPRIPPTEWSPFSEPQRITCSVPGRLRRQQGSGTESR
jgi:hypothetical protein